MVSLPLDHLWDIHRRHSSDLRVSACSLPVCQKNDRFTVGRHLYRTEHRAVGNNIRRLFLGDKRSFQAAAHSVKITGNRIFTVQESLNPLSAEHIVLGTHDHTDLRLFLVKFIQFKFPGKEERQIPSLNAEIDVIPGLQLPALKTADTALRIGAAASHDHRNIQITGESDVASASRSRAFEFQDISLVHIKSSVHRRRFPVDFRLKISSCDGNDRSGCEFQCRPDQGKFQNRFVFRIVQKKIGYFKGAYVHHSGDRETLALISCPSKVLNRRVHSALEYTNSHFTPLLRGLHTDIPRGPPLL